MTLKHRGTAGRNGVRFVPPRAGKIGLDDQRDE